MNISKNITPKWVVALGSAPFSSNNLAVLYSLKWHAINKELLPV